jgi:hypothetical protein
MEKLEAKAPVTLMAHDRGRAHRRARVRDKKLDSDGLTDEEL